jgi:hypothetical protein
VRGIRHGLAIVAGLAAVAFTIPAAAEENPALLETLEIMRERGLIDEAKHAELVAKNQAWEASHPSLLSRLQWSGDFRGRLENFWYDRDDFGTSTQDRTRGRYRLRIGAEAEINEVVTAGFRIASGDGDHRSTNQSFGSGDDFDKDGLYIDEAYAELAVPGRFLPEGMSVKSIVGKQSNPFVWKNGKDFMIWDNDITPEGVGVQIGGSPGESLSLFANAGYFIVDEESSSKDPHVFGIQGGFGLLPYENIELGGRASFYDWRSVDDPFLTRTNESGSLITDERDYQVVELSAYSRFTHHESWPVLVYGQVAQNLEADSPGGTGDEDLGWGFGIEVGDKKKYVMIGGGYYHVEANFSPSQFTDSDLFDGFTNREGFLVYASRQLFSNTDLNLTFFSGDEIESGAAFDLNAIFPDDSFPSAERYRLQTDLIVKF